jgi:DNA-binding CsgD family transcriptional regulator
LRKPAGGDKLVQMTGSGRPAPAQMELVSELARAVSAAGARIGLPYIAASADISSPLPMRAVDGRPFAETLFRWVDPGLAYWRDRGFALRAPFVLACRYSSEPFYFADGRFGAWRPAPRLEAVDASTSFQEYGVAAAIIAPAYLPGGRIGAIVWATPDQAVDARAIYQSHAVELHALALKFLAAYQDAESEGAGPPVRLTRREIQCLKWVAAGKTDAETGQIIAVSTPTVRFHLRNAARKLGATGRAQALNRAAGLGYVGAFRPQA